MATVWSPLAMTHLDLPPPIVEETVEFPLSMSHLDLPPPIVEETEIGLEAIEWVVPLAATDIISPVVTYIYPGEFDTLRVADPIIFSTVDLTSNLRRILVAVEIVTTGIQELVHDGLSFTSTYIGRSSRTVIENGFEYVVRRRQGWPTGTQVRVRVWAVDSAGNIENT